MSNVKNASNDKEPTPAATPPNAPTAVLTRAFTLPFAVFLIALALVEPVKWGFADSTSVLLRHPAFLVYPIQTLACLGILVFYWRRYPWKPVCGLGWGVLAGLGALGIWLAPQLLLGQAPRTEGFNPELLKDQPALYTATIAFRFLRLVIVVPLLEEIFWRGFLMRYLAKERWTELPFGACNQMSFLVTAAAFALVHQVADMPAAFLTGLLFNAVAVKTRSLAACVIAHAVTNLALGIYIMRTGQWGFW